MQFSAKRDTHLRVVVPAVADRAVGRADGQTTHIPLPASAVPVLGRLAGNLVKGWKYVVRELNLCTGQAHAADA